MRRVATPFIVGLAVVALLLSAILGGAGLFQSTRAAFAQPATPTATPTSGAEHMLPAQLQFLSSMTPQQRFDHFTGSQMTWVNPQGQQVVVGMVPGKVTSMTSNTLTMQPNGATTTRTFNVTSSTIVRGAARQGTLSAFSTGQRVIVTTVNNSDDAVAIMTPAFEGTGMNDHGRGGMMPGGMGRATRTAPTAPTATPTP